MIELARTALDLAARAGKTLAVAESLTGGLVCDALVTVPGASSVLRGGVVAYATDVKASVLGVDRDLLARSGAVHPLVAQQMAEGVARLLGADIGIATTGVAGPGPDGRHPAGTVFVAVAPTASGADVDRLGLEGGRDAVRAAATVSALQLLVRVLDQDSATREQPGGAGR